jgi:hypothetical protein
MISRTGICESIETEFLKFQNKLNLKW